MTSILGALNVNDRDRLFNGTIGQQTIYDEVARYVALYNEELQRMSTVFVSGQTELYKFKHKLPASGMLSPRGIGDNSNAVKVTGSWEVALPIYDFGNSVGVNDDVDLAKMTVQEFELHVNGIIDRHTRRRRYELLRSLYNSANATFADPDYGSLTIRRLANTDGTLYPPVRTALPNQETEAQAQSYVGTNYLPAAIDDTNNPLVTAVNFLEDHFGSSTGGDDVVTFVHRNNLAEFQALTDFVPYADMRVRQGVDADVPINLPNVPGTIRGISNGSWVVEWNQGVPANYTLSLRLDEMPPLMERVDEADTGLETGLQLVADEGLYPVRNWYWRDRFGYGVVERRNGFVQFITNSTSYTVPAALA